METRQVDVVVIGGGPGGASAAARIAAKGLSVSLVEDRLVGGECHYWACNPTKTLLRPIEVLALAKAVPGVREVVCDLQLDVAAVLAKRDAIVDYLEDGDAVMRMGGAGAEVIHGRGRLSGPRTVTVYRSDGQHDTLVARQAVVLATGTRPTIPDVPGLVAAQPWTNRDLSVMATVPPRTLVLGGGVVGVEFATILAGLGSEVTMVVRAGRLLRNSEPVAAQMVTDSLRHMGVEIAFDCELSQVARSAADGPVTVEFGDRRFEVDEIVVAAGRAVNTTEIGLETVGLLGGEFVRVDDHLEAVGVEGRWLYAIGDTTGRALLSHISQYHAGIVADVIAARSSGRQLGDGELIALDAGNLAQVIFTDPQVVEVGRSEDQARVDGFVVTTRTARFPESVPLLAILRDGFQGWAKLVVDAQTNTLLGATFVGPGFGDLVQAATLAVVARVPVDVLRHVVAPHPSLNQVWNALLAAEH